MENSMSIKNHSFSLGNLKMRVTHAADNLKEKIIIAFALFLGLGTFFTVAAAWITHILVSIKTSSWILLIIGIFVPPIGWIHGIGYWFGFFS